MEVTLFGIAIVSNSLQSRNASFPIVFTLLGIIKDSIPEETKVVLPIVVTLLGIVIVFRFVQPTKELHREVTLFGIMVLEHPTYRVFVAVSIIALQPSLESYLLLLLSTTIEVRYGQLSNAKEVIVTFSGIKTDDNFVPEKASMDIFLKVFGKAIDVSPDPENASDCIS